MASDIEDVGYIDNTEDKLKELRSDIEKLRYELQNTASDKGCLCNHDKTYTISAKLDSLIVQFMRVKEELEGS